MADWKLNRPIICLFFISKMLKLILTRHAKSSWDDPLIYDHDRALNARGVKSGRAIGRWLKDQEHLPDVILTSSATRAQATAELIAGELDFKGEFIVESGIYHASADTMMKHLRRMDKKCVVMVGHNPGIADFAARLLSEIPDHSRFYDYPTAATLVASAKALSWKSVHFGALHPVDFVIPRQLLEPENTA